MWLRGSRKAAEFLRLAGIEQFKSAAEVLACLLKEVHKDKRDGANLSG